MIDDPPSAVTSNSSHARPGNFISASKRSRRFGSITSTRQKSSASPMRNVFGDGLPRRTPIPPMSKSSAPRNFQSQFQAYQPLSPPIFSIAWKARFGAVLTRIVRESTKREPNFTPPHTAGEPAVSGEFNPEDESASDQRVVANCSSSLLSARRTAVSSPIGRMGNAVNADLSRTTVECTMLATNLRPMRA